MNKKKMQEFSQKKEERGLNISWGANGRIDNMTEEYIDVLTNAGCTMLQFGIESGSKKVLDFYGKRMDLSAVPSVMAMCQDRGIKTGAYFIVGAPMETQEDVRKSYELISQLNLDFLDVSILTPMPGTPLFESTKGNIDFNKLDEMGSRFGSSIYKKLNIIPIEERTYLLSDNKK